MKDYKEYNWLYSEVDDRHGHQGNLLKGLSISFLIMALVSWLVLISVSSCEDKKQDNEYKEFRKIEAENKRMFDTYCI